MRLLSQFSQLLFHAVHRGREPRLRHGGSSKTRSARTAAEDTAPKEFTTAHAADFYTPEQEARDSNAVLCPSLPSRGSNPRWSSKESSYSYAERKQRAGQFRHHSVTLRDPSSLTQILFADWPEVQEKNGSSGRTRIRVKT